MISKGSVTVSVSPGFTVRISSQVPSFSGRAGGSETVVWVTAWLLVVTECVH